MEKDKKYIRRTFWVHQYEKEEEFLSEMASEGWQFVKLHKGIPTKYEFIRGEKINYIYQLDFVANEEDTADYHQLFADAGWDEVYSWNGIGGKWYYFRRIRSDGRCDKIFTDSESKYHMYEKLWKKFGLYLLLSIFLELNGIRVCTDTFNHVNLLSVLGIFILALCIIFGIFTVIFVYCIIGILIEKNRIKARLNEKL